MVFLQGKLMDGKIAFFPSHAGVLAMALGKK